jgi:hypothetical protein
MEAERRTDVQTGLNFGAIGADCGLLGLCFTDGSG